MPAFKYEEIWPCWARVSPGPQWLTLDLSCPSYTQPHPFLSASPRPSTPTGARAVAIFSVLMLLFFFKEKNISPYPWLCHGQTERSIGLNPTLFIDFISFLDPQAAEVHFHPKWKGSVAFCLSGRRAHDLHKECVVSVYSAPMKCRLTQQQIFMKRLRIRRSGDR